MQLLYLFLLTFGSIFTSDAYNILIVAPNLSKSHARLAFGYTRHLLAAGHDVTIITPYPEINPHPKLRQVDVSEIFKLFKPELFTIKAILGNETYSNLYGMLLEASKLFLYHEKELIKNKNVQELLNDETINFDLVIAEWFHSNVFAGFATVYNCPLFWASTTEAHWMVLSLVDKQTDLAHTADVNISALPPYTFLQRIFILFSMGMVKLSRFLYFSSRDRNHYEELFGPLVTKRGRVLPPYEEVLYNGSFVFSNSHPSYGGAISLPPNAKEIGGFWIENEPAPLPKDLQNLMDNAKNGVIYFSMGTIWKSKDMPEKMKQDLLTLFSELPQTVIWKFEENIPNVPANIHIVNWAPQHSILAHPNCQLFVTHGGILSVTETVAFGVPVVGLPLGYDQHLNLNRAVLKGFGLKVDLGSDMTDKLKLAIQEVLTNNSYRIRAKEVSAHYHDRPVPPGQEIVHWVEHVIKTRGAPHLRSPANVPWYQTSNIDILLFILTLYTSILALVATLLYLRNKRRTKRSEKEKTQ